MRGEVRYKPLIGANTVLPGALDSGHYLHLGPGAVSTALPVIAFLRVKRFFLTRVLVNVTGVQITQYEQQMRHA